MKLFLVLSLTVFSAAAFAWEPFTVPVWVYKNHVTALVDNTSEFPIECYGTVYGQLGNGQVLTKEFNEPSIWQYNSVAVEVHSSEGAFVKGWAKVFCR